MKCAVTLYPTVIDKMAHIAKSNFPQFTAYGFKVENNIPVSIMSTAQTEWTKAFYVNAPKAAPTIVLALYMECLATLHNRIRGAIEELSDE